MIRRIRVFSILKTGIATLKSKLKYKLKGKFISKLNEGIDCVSRNYKSEQIHSLLNYEYFSEFAHLNNMRINKFLSHQIIIVHSSL